MSISVNPQQVTLTAPAGSKVPATQTLTLLTTGQNPPFTASVRYLGQTSGWLSVKPTAGTPPATLTVSADASQLAAGSYLAQVTVTAGTIGTFANVLFVVDPGPGGIADPRPGAATFVASPSTLTFIGTAGSGMLQPQTVALTSASGDAVPFLASASSAGNWLTVTQSPSSTLPGTLTVQANASAATPGTYTGAVTVRKVDGADVTVIPVVLSVTGQTTGTVTLSQTSLTVNHQIGTAAPPVRTVDVGVTGGYAYVFTASTTDSWLRLTTFFSPVPTTTVTYDLPGQFSVVIDPTGLSVGTYVGTVTVAVAGVGTQQLPVTLTVTPDAALNAIPSSISFDGAAAAQASVTVTSTGSSSLAFTAAVTQGASWLSVTPNAGSTTSGAQLLTVKANTSGLAPGNYNGAVTLTVTGTGTTLGIPVMLSIASPPYGVGLDVSTTSVNLTGVTGLAAPSQAINIGVAGGYQAQEFTAAASSTQGWLSVTPFLGAAPTKLTVTANPAAVSPGTYQGTVTLTTLPSGTQATIPVTFTLAAKAIMATPASLSFTQEQKGVAPAPQSVQITANTSSSFTVSTTTSWIKVNPRGGTAGGGLTVPTLAVSVDPSGLPAGIQNGSILVSGPDNQVTVPVSLTIPAPTLAATPAAMSFAYQLGSAPPAPQSVSISSTFDAMRFAITAATESGVKWLAADPLSGSTPATANVNINTALLVVGKHSGTITIAPEDGSTQPCTVAVTVTVTASPVSVQGVLHGATEAPTPLAPGQIVTVGGVGLGPVAGAAGKPSAAGAYAAQLADTRVLFDGVPAPLLSVRFDQVSAVVPYALHGRLSARIQVESGASLSIPIEAKVVDAAPGLFVTGTSGRGQAAAVNMDLTPNSPANPAPRGSIISLFGTGEGQTDPPGQDGRVILTDLRRPLLRVSARIGGRLADVTYAGSAPGMVSGVFQVDVRIPDDIPAGSVPIEVQVGGAATQSGVTIAVR